MTGRIQGKVIEISVDGDLITDILAKDLVDVSRSPETKIVVDEDHETFGIFEPTHDQPPMTLIAILESDGPLRLNLVSDSAAMMLGVRAGARVEVVW